uniref:Cellulose synthase-like protein G3 n=2 Tax=Rhizophora mucronata TaxID=61149 RepID=A0A2P2KHT3_RHIMU
MENARDCRTSPAAHAPLLHIVKPMPQMVFNRVFAAIYLCAILTFLYYRVKTLISSSTLAYFSINLALLISEILLAFMWVNTQALRMSPVCRQEFPENVEKVLERSHFPGLDVFICTADPYKEPLIGVVNTAVSVMAYDYPTEKISVYISDDGGSALTLFAVMEAAKFASHWLPFCKKSNLADRSPEAYFNSNQSWSPEIEKIKIMYEGMKVKVEHVLERGKIDDEYITGKSKRRIFDKWTDKFTRQEHPTVIEVLLDSTESKDLTGDSMPNLIYVTRQKGKASPHHFKAGALNVLLRVSAALTNAPIVLTLDCDMYSNDPQTPLRALCYLCDPALRSRLGYVQFPQRYQGINKNDIYAGEYKRLFIVQPIGFDGLLGPNYVGTGCFFNRRALFGGPSAVVSPEIPELAADHFVDKPIQSQSSLALAHHVASCNYEEGANWGSEVGFRYGSLVEDYYTGYRLACEGWMSLFCNPERAAFLGDAPINLVDALSQQKRWSVGLLEVAFSKYCPLTFGIKNMGPLMGLGYAQYSFWPIWSIPITTYAFLPQLALLNKVCIFPKVLEPWFLLYVFLFLGANGQDFLDFFVTGGTFGRWWNDQRIWHIRGLTCYIFGLIEFLLKSLGISTPGFNVTNKVVDDEQSKRYEQGIFEFGVHSRMFVPLTMAAILNLLSFVQGLVQVFGGNNLEGLLVPMFLSGFCVVNCWPIYEAVALRSDKGKLPTKTTIVALLLTWVAYMLSSLIFTS